MYGGNLLAEVTRDYCFLNQIWGLEATCLSSSWQWPEDQPLGLHAEENLTRTGASSPHGGERGGDDPGEC